MGSHGKGKSYKSMGQGKEESSLKSDDKTSSKEPKGQSNNDSVDNLEAEYSDFLSKGGIKMSSSGRVKLLDKNTKSLPFDLQNKDVIDEDVTETDLFKNEENTPSNIAPLHKKEKINASGAKEIDHGIQGTETGENRSYPEEVHIGVKAADKNESEKADVDTDSKQNYGQQQDSRAVQLSEKFQEESSKQGINSKNDLEPLNEDVNNLLCQKGMCENSQNTSDITTQEHNNIITNNEATVYDDTIIANKCQDDNTNISSINGGHLMMDTEVMKKHEIIDDTKKENQENSKGLSLENSTSLIKDMQVKKDITEKSQNNDNEDVNLKEVFDKEKNQKHQNYVSINESQIDTVPETSECKEAVLDSQDKSIIAEGVKLTDNVLDVLTTAMKNDKVVEKVSFTGEDETDQTQTNEKENNGIETTIKKVYGGENMQVQLPK